MIDCILIIGAGAIAHHHAAAARKLSPLPRIVVADPNEPARSRFSTAFPEATVFASAEEMLALPVEGAEIVIVATPPFLHHPHALAGLRSGRHTLVEKPMALNIGEAESLWAEARARGLELACCSCRFSARPITAEIRGRLLAGDIGEGWRVRWQVRNSGEIPGIGYQPESRWFLDRSKAGHGSLFDWGCYDVAVWNEIIQPERVTVDAAWLGYPRRGTPAPPDVVFDVEHQVIAFLRLHRADGIVVPVTFERANTGYGGDLNITQIEGRRGALDWDWLGWEGTRIRWHHETAPGNCVVDEIEGPEEKGLTCHDYPLVTFASRLAGKPMPDVAGAQALFNFRILDAIAEVARTGSPVTVSR